LRWPEEWWVLGGCKRTFSVLVGLASGVYVGVKFLVFLPLRSAGSCSGVAVSNRLEIRYVRYAPKFCLDRS